MKKVFISQPMNGKTDDEIKDERIKALEIVKERLSVDEEIEIEEIKSFFEGAPHDAKPLWFLGESLKLLGTADIVVFCKDWEYFRGCRIEHTCAVEYGIKDIIYM